MDLNTILAKKPEELSDEENSCDRRSKNPSVKRPGSPVAPE
jgi:hypothetical protein